MHDGGLPDLAAVLSHYLHGVIKRPSVSKDIKEISLTEEETQLIIAFLETLTEDSTEVSAPVLPAN